MPGGVYAGRKEVTMSGGGMVGLACGADGRRAPALTEVSTPRSLAGEDGGALGRRVGRRPPSRALVCSAPQIDWSAGVKPRSHE